MGVNCIVVIGRCCRDARQCVSASLRASLHRPHTWRRGTPDCLNCDFRMMRLIGVMRLTV